MPTKVTQLAKRSKEKAVIVAVYVETPKRRLSSNIHHNHHHHEVHKPSHGASGRGHNRRAELLDYSRHLRESARSAVPSVPFKPKPVPASNNQQPAPSVPLQPKPVPASNNQRPMTPIAVRVNCKPNNAAIASLINWKIVLPSFLRSMITPRAKEGRRKEKKGNVESEATKVKAGISGTNKRRGSFKLNCFQG